VGGRGREGGREAGGGGFAFNHTNTPLPPSLPPSRYPPSLDRMAALDCEMCQTTEGMEVTRLTLVDEQRQVLLDSFVKPHNMIVDHLTKYSGITPEIMSACTTRLEQVQVALLRLVRAETILVGHSLEQDLMVVGLIHLRCVDTAMLYPHPRGPQCRFALRVLVKKYLGRVIQDSALGHCSQEDAEAALDLVKLKMEHGPEFGVEGEGGREGGEEGLVRGRESFLERLGGRWGKRCALLDQSETLVRVIRGSSASAVVCRSNEEVLSKAKAQGRQAVAPHFMWASLVAARPLTMESLEARRKRKVYQQQQRMEAEATEAAAAAAAAAGVVEEEAAAAATEREGGREGGRKRHKGEVISLMSRNGSSSSLCSSSSSSSSSSASLRTSTTCMTTSSGSSRMTTTTTVLRDSTTTLTCTAATATTTTTTTTAATARRHKRFLYQESIMEMVEPDLLRADQQLAELYESLPTNTLLLVLAQPDVALPTQLTNQRTAALHSRRATLPWTEEHEATLQELAKAAQKGVVMMRVR